MIIYSLLLAAGTTFSAPSRSPADTAGVRQELRDDIALLEQKVVALAQAMDEKQYDWAPMEGVRTVRQVYLHIAIGNYGSPTLTGTEPPAAIDLGDNFEGAAAYEDANLSKAEVVSQLRDSFEHLKTALDQAGDLDRTVDLPGQSVTARAIWLQTVFHIHEHLGQAIAYARANHVVPPWSR